MPFLRQGIHHGDGMVPSRESRVEGKGLPEFIKDPA